MTPLGSALYRIAHAVSSESLEQVKALQPVGEVVMPISSESLKLLAQSASAPMGELAGKPPPSSPAPAKKLLDYAGTYNNRCFGAAKVTVAGEHLELALGPGKVQWVLTHWEGDVFSYQPYNENAPPGTVGKATFHRSSLVLELLNAHGLRRHNACRARHLEPSGDDDVSQRVGELADSLLSATSRRHHMDWGRLISTLAAGVAPVLPQLLAVLAAILVISRPLPGRGPRLFQRADPWRVFKYETRRQVMSRAGHRCEGAVFLAWGRCREAATEADHVYPWSRGGPTSPCNGQALCRGHNRHKAATKPPWWYVLSLEHRRRSYFPPGEDVRVSAAMSDRELTRAKTSEPRSTH